MYGLNAFALVGFGCINVLAVRLSRCDARLRSRVLDAACVLLLAFNLIRYALYPLTGQGLRIPVEFSTVAYFAVPAIMLTRRRGALSWAAYSGLMAGFFYYLAMITAGGPVYDTYPHWEIYASLCCHGTVYLCGFVVINTERCESSDWYKLALGIALVAVRAALLRPLAAGQGRLLIYELLDAQPVKWLLPQSSWGAAVPLYYLILAALLAVSILLFFRLNRREAIRHA